MNSGLLTRNAQRAHSERLPSPKPCVSPTPVRRHIQTLSTRGPGLRGRQSRTPRSNTTTDLRFRCGFRRRVRQGRPGGSFDRVLEARTQIRKTPSAPSPERLGQPSQHRSSASRTDRSAQRRRRTPGSSRRGPGRMGGNPRLLRASRVGTGSPTSSIFGRYVRSLLGRARYTVRCAPARREPRRARDGVPKPESKLGRGDPPGQGAEPKCVMFRASLNRTAGARQHFGIATFV